MCAPTVGAASFRDQSGHPKTGTATTSLGTILRVRRLNTGLLTGHPMRSSRPQSRSSRHTSARVWPSHDFDKEWIGLGVDLSNMVVISHDNTANPFPLDIRRKSQIEYFKRIVTPGAPLTSGGYLAVPLRTACGTGYPQIYGAADWVIGTFAGNHARPLSYGYWDSMAAT